MQRLINMKELKPIDYKLLYELMKNSHRSDRQLAKVLGISQPTVTRRRAMLEENFIEGYTVIPKFFEIGFEIVALTCFKTVVKDQKGQTKEESIKKLKEWFTKQNNVVMVTEGLGMGWNSACFSYHENYTSFTDFKRKLESELSDWVLESQTFIINLRTDTVFKSLHLKYLTFQKK